MKPRIVAVIAIALILMQVPTTLHAQSENGQRPPQADACQAKPRGEQGGRSDGNADLAEKLDRCGSVLRPPSSADQEIEKQPPETGSTPVIPPSQLPNQAEPR